jgi:membrane-bound serine protease (ClpP class)
MSLRRGPARRRPLLARWVACALLTAGTPAPASEAEPTSDSLSEERATSPPAKAREDSLSEASRSFVVVVRWDDAITPVTRRFLADAIEKAAEDGAAALVIELDTPGGLVDATRDIVSDFFEAPLPILVWVGPSGARAASAGTFLTLAAHVGAMAPGTNIGAASPVTMGGGVSDSTMASKMLNDTSAFARSIAERRGRNAEWAEKAVRDADAITEKEALEKNVVDFVARDVRELLEQAHARKVETPAGELELHSSGARLERRELSLRFRLLSYLANPNIAYVLLMLGIYGIFFELSNPGSILPGVVGVIFLILAFFSLQTLPMNLAGLLLIIVGTILFILEAHITSFGLLAIAGVGCTVIGAVMLFDPRVPHLRLSLGVVLPVTLALAALFAIGAGLSVRTLRSKPTTGREGMLGLKGIVRKASGSAGVVEVHGELWNVVGEEPLAVGDIVEVVEVKGLSLTVKRV